MSRQNLVHTALLCVICVIAHFPAAADDNENHAQAIAAKSYYLVGNSLTWDTVPAALDGDTQWHVDCGKSLPFIVEHPEAPCVKSSTVWPQALKERQYDYVCLQVHYGANLREDAAAVTELIRHQPGAVIVIHTGWARSAERVAEWVAEWEQSDDDESTPMSHSPMYIAKLLNRLREQHPTRVFRRTRAMDLLHQIDSDIAAGVGPIESVDSLYRDKIHMNLTTGRYLMHNAMRIALGQKTSATGFEKLDPKLKQYFDDVLTRVCGAAAPAVAD